MERAQQYVLDNVIPVPECGCWLWNKSWSGTGYGQFELNGKSYLSHRYSYSVFVSPIPEDMCVLHKCDTRSCVNPDHLFLGTKGDNARDAVRKGRQTRTQGSRNGHAKLDESKVSEIRSSTKKQKELAAEFGVDQSVISEVKTRKIWRHV